MTHDPPESATAPELVIAKLEPLLLPRRVARLRAVLAARSDHVAFVFERMTDPHNLSAALRSLDAFGFQVAHWIAPDAELGLSHLITRGTDRWLTLSQHADTTVCFAALRAQGYCILASEVPVLSGAAGQAPGSPSAPPLDSLDLRQRTAFVFGNEHAGVRPETLALSDGRFHIPMVGFAESLNLSVACAITAYHTRRELRHLAAVTGDVEAFGLSEAHRRALYADWLRQCVRGAEQVLRE
jgi:tRNA (guanosine-2'-O-)-methyltransferase